MDEDLVSLLVCPKCGSDAFLLDKFSSDGNDVIEGTLWCGTCHIWYKISKGVPDLLPPELRRHELYKDFAEKFGLPYVIPKDPCMDSQKRDQILFFKNDFSSYEEDIVNSNYYRGLDEITFEKWLERNIDRIHGPILEVGCGTGRQSVKIGARGKTAVCIDISEEMINIAKSKVEHLKNNSKIHFIIGDAENPPVRDNRFGAGIICATLHHLPSPEKAIYNISRKMTVGGVFFSIDPHATPIRFLFDLLMKYWKLYDEETGRCPLIDGKKLRQWLLDAGISPHISYSTYFPPHFFLLLREESSSSFLKNSDEILNRIPLAFKFSGIIISEGIKVR